MPKYWRYKIGGYYLYFTAHCIVEPIHVHASDTNLTESSSAKLWIKENGDTIVVSHGNIPPASMKKIQKFIKINISSIKETWENFSGYTEFIQLKEDK